MFTKPLTWIVIVGGFISLTGGGMLLGDWLGLVLGLMLAGLTLYIFVKSALLRVPEHHMAVIHNRGHQAFARLLAPGHHLLFPVLEECEGWLITSTQRATGKAEVVHSADGIPCSIEWGVSFRLMPDFIAPEMQADLMPKLVRYAKDIVANNANDCLRLMLGRYSAEVLVRAGLRGKLTDELQAAVQERLQPLGFKIGRVMLGAITPPKAFQEALNKAQELAALQRAIHAFTECDMQRLAELGRLHAMDQHGVTMLYPIAPLSPPSSNGNGNGTGVLPGGVKLHSNGRHSAEAPPTPLAE